MFIKIAKYTISASAIILFANTAKAQSFTAGHIASLQHWTGHGGILVKLKESMADTQGCGRSDWYIFPDSNAHAQFVQAMLLTAQEANRNIILGLNGCLDGFPVIMAVEKAMQ